MKNTTKKKKKTWRPEKTFFQRRHTNGQQAHKKILEISNHQKCRLKPQWAITSHLSEWLHAIRVYKNQMLLGVWRKEKHCWWECKMVQPLRKTIWMFLKNLKTELPHDPAIPLLGIYPGKTKSLIQKYTCTPKFTAAQFTNI